MLTLSELVMAVNTVQIVDWLLVKLQYFVCVLNKEKAKCAYGGLTFDR